MKLVIETIPNEEQRYPTVGDWLWCKDDAGQLIIQIKVSAMSNWKHELLVGIHEAIEAALCIDRNISEEDVTNFDVQFELERSQGLHTPTEEPGDSPGAPYFYEHAFATKVEKEFASQLNINWEEYNNEVESL